MRAQRIIRLQTRRRPASTLDDWIDDWIAAGGDLGLRWYRARAGRQAAVFDWAAGTDWPV